MISLTIFMGIEKAGILEESLGFPQGRLLGPQAE